MVFELRDVRERENEGLLDFRRRDVGRFSGNSSIAREREREESRLRGFSDVRETYANDLRSYII